MHLSRKARSKGPFTTDCYGIQLGVATTADGFRLEHRATRPLWVYVLSQDEEGEPGLLFPLPESRPRIRWPAASGTCFPVGAGAGRSRGPARRRAMAGGCS